MSHVFISYSRKDTEYAHKLAEELEKQRIKVWFDDRIKTGADWWKTIHKAIMDCAAYIVIMTPESEASDWVQDEITIARNNKKPAFPILLEGDSELTKSPNWSMYARTQYTNLKSGELPDSSFYESLRNAVSQNTPKVHFDFEGYYVSETYYHQPSTTYHYTYAITFMSDGTLTHYSLMRPGMMVKGTKRPHILDDGKPDKGTYKITGDIIDIHITASASGDVKDDKYHGYIEGDNLKLEIDETIRRMYEIPWEQRERRLYTYEPLPTKEQENDD